MSLKDNWLNKKKELEILKAVDKMEEEGNKEPTTEELILKFRDLIFSFYPRDIQKTCTYESLNIDCGMTCAFKDNKNLCPVQALIERRLSFGKGY